LDGLLEESHDSHLREHAYQALNAELTQAENEMILEVGDLLDQDRFEQAASSVREWMFLNKMIAQLRAID
jgi:hypothetical protein